MSDQEKRVYKVAIVGNGVSGKTTLLKSLMEVQRAIRTEYSNYIGSGHYTMMDMLEFSESENAIGMHDMCSGADGVIAMIDMSRAEAVPTTVNLILSIRYTGFDGPIVVGGIKRGGWNADSNRIRSMESVHAYFDVMNCMPYSEMILSLFHAIAEKVVTPKEPVNSEEVVTPKEPVNSEEVVTPIILTKEIVTTSVRYVQRGNKMHKETTVRTDVVTTEIFECGREYRI